MAKRGYGNDGKNKFYRELKLDKQTKKLIKAFRKVKEELLKKND